MLESNEYSYRHYQADLNYRLKPSGFKDIYFYDIEKGDKAPIYYTTTGSYSGKNSDLSIESGHSLALGWTRQYAFVGTNSPTTIFDPNYDFEVTCLLMKDPLRVVGFAHRMLGN